MIVFKTYGYYAHVDQKDYPFCRSQGKVHSIMLKINLTINKITSSIQIDWSR